MTTNRVFLFLTVAVILAGMKSCKTITRLSRQNLEFLYDETKFELSPGYMVFHHSEDSSILYHTISSDELHYVRNSEKESYRANYKIHYRLLESFTANVVIDSLTATFTDTVFHQSGLNITDSLVMGIPGGERYILHLTMTDINRQVQSTKLLKVNKTGDDNFQYYKIFDIGDDDNGKMLMFSPMISESGNFIMQYKADISQEASVKIYATPQSVALPPFVDKTRHVPDMIPDTVFNIIFEGGIAVLPVNKNGLYRIVLDNETSGGTSLHYYYDGFPRIEDDSQLLPPLRYLTSNEEFETLTSYLDPADAADIFWTSMAGTHLRGRKMVDRYYDNIERSNKYFTTWKEGWKTDRGMIYSVFGAPDRVLKDDDSEKWTYYGTWRVPDTDFNFREIDAPFGMKCYELERKPEYRNVWFQTVERIRR